MAIVGLIVTGAAGFIGLNFLEKLDEKSYDFIISVDKMGYATTYNKERYYQICKEKNIYVINCDINDLSKLNSIEELSTLGWSDIDIIDFASESHVDNSIADPFSIYTQNASIPANLLAWVGKENWEKIRMYYHISTDEIYSEISLDDVKKIDKWFTINSPIKPNNPYSASKAAQDCFLMAMRHTFKIPVKFIRLSNQFGIYQHIEKMLPASINRILNKKPVKIYGIGENVRQWTPVGISVSVISDILQNKIIFDDCIHIANKDGVYNNNEIIKILSDVMGEFSYNVDVEYVEDRRGHDTAYALYTEKCVDEYFYNCDINNYVRETVKYYLERKCKFTH